MPLPVLTITPKSLVRLFGAPVPPFVNSIQGALNDDQFSFTNTLKRYAGGNTYVEGSASFYGKQYIEVGITGENLSDYQYVIEGQYFNSLSTELRTVASDVELTITPQVGSPVGYARYVFNGQHQGPSTSIITSVATNIGNQFIGVSTLPGTDANTYILNNGRAPGTPYYNADDGLASAGSISNITNPIAVTYVYLQDFTGVPLTPLNIPQSVSHGYMRSVGTGSIYYGWQNISARNYTLTNGVWVLGEPTVTPFDIGNYFFGVPSNTSAHYLPGSSTLSYDARPWKPGNYIVIARGFQDFPTSDGYPHFTNVTFGLRGYDGSTPYYGSIPMPSGQTQYKDYNYYPIEPLEHVSVSPNVWSKPVRIFIDKAPSTVTVCVDQGIGTTVGGYSQSAYVDGVAGTFPMGDGVNRTIYTYTFAPYSITVPINQGPDRAFFTGLTGLPPGAALGQIGGLMPLVFTYEGTRGTTYGPSQTKPSLAGNYKVTASTGVGNDYYHGSTSVPVEFTIIKADQTITGLAATDSKVYGASYTLSVRKGTSTSALTFASSDTTVATIDAGGIVRTKAAGTTTLTVNQAGDANHNAALPVTQTLTVTKPSTTIATKSGDVTLAGYVNQTVGARFNQPKGFVVVGDSIYVADSGNHCIRKIAVGGQVTTFAGAAPTTEGFGTAGYLDGIGTAARFWYPSDICVSSDGLTLFVADTFNRVIRKIVIATGVVTTVAGVPLSSGNVDGDTPLLGEISSIAVSPTSNGVSIIYALDTSYRVIRGFALLNGNFVTSYRIAGVTEGSAALVDGNINTGKLQNPKRIAYKSISESSGVFVGQIWITDGSSIRKWQGSTSGTGVIPTINEGAIVSGDASLTTIGNTSFTGMYEPVSLSTPEGISFYPEASSPVIADPGRKVILDSHTSQCIAGRPDSQGVANGVGVSRLYNPCNVIATSFVSGYIIDNNAIRSYAMTGTPLSQSITFSLANPSSLLSGEKRTLSATSTSLNPVVLTSSNVLVAETSQNTLTAIKAGTARITAATSGDRDYNSASTFADITISNPIPIVSNLTTAGEVGIPFSYNITATENPISYNVGTLPDGLAVYAGNIFGTPTEAGVTNVPVSVTSALGANGIGTVVITIAAASGRITSALTSTTSFGADYLYQITANGTPTSFNATNLPAGLTVNTATGLISGTPTSPGTTSVTISASQGGSTKTAVMILKVIELVNLGFILTQNKPAADGESSPWVTATKEGNLVTVVVNRAPSVGLETGDVKCATIELSTPASGRSLAWQANVDLDVYVPPPALTVSPTGPISLNYSATDYSIIATLSNAPANQLTATITGSNAQFDNNLTTKTFSAETSFSVYIRITGVGSFSVALSVASLGLSKTVEFSVGAQAITMQIAEVSSEYSLRTACSSSGNNSANNCLAIIKYGDVAKMQLTSSTDLFTGATPKAALSKNSNVGTGGDITLGGQQATSAGPLKSIFDVTGVYPGSIGISASLPAAGRLGAGTASAVVQVNKATLTAKLFTDSNSNYGIWKNNVGAVGEDYCSVYNRFVGSYGGNYGMYRLSLKHVRCSAFDLDLPQEISSVVFVTYPEITSNIPLAYITNSIPGNNIHWGTLLPDFTYAHTITSSSVGQIIEFPITGNFSHSVFFNTFRGFDGGAGGLNGRGALDCTSGPPIDPPTPYYFRSGSISQGVPLTTNFNNLFGSKIQNRAEPTDIPGITNFFTTRFMTPLAPASASISVYVLPEMPYNGATLADYFDLSGTARTLTYGTDFFGESFLGNDYFPVGQARTFRKIAQINIAGSTITNTP